MKFTNYKFSIYFLFLVSLVACKKEDDEILSSGELIALELKEIVENKQINLASVYTIEYYSGEPYLSQMVDKKLFSITNIFLVINEKQYYNLDKLDRFEIISTEDPNFIEFYFLNN